MNQTTEDSNGRVIIVGGDTIPQEDGRIEIPPEQAKNFTPVLENIELDNMTISMSDCKAEDVLTPEQIEEFEAGKEEARPWQSEKRNEIEK